ncbi:protein tyrosine phosphatase [Flavobacterium limnosediminis JC2902]|uniref:protein-tyrosine-phosphatase n=2 Tax=Flavobacterium TaxID=237 RepID=V6SRI6_9FLAO|nr:protein tyrosine phosphatase [Flavobacterium limnosediminis JC2902]
MVCLGNICRSPLAEGILQSKLPKEQFEVDSAGTGSWHIGQKPDERSVLIAKNKGLDITHQRGRQINKADFDIFDYIYVMDISNYHNVIALAPDEEAKLKVTMILDELFPGENVDVPDPYFGGQNGFEQVFMMLDEACEIIAQKLKAKH